MVQKLKKESIIIPKKAMLGIAPLLPIIGILLSKGNPAGLILVGIGVFSGFFIARGYFEK
ncbi:hypothetical protein ISS05_00325 [Candidatus Woesearchaeota archaeon]|nr:hypothetical protein [Candidatus Woesearchaeota archaeon]